MQKKRYVQVGIGGRSFMYTDAIVKTYKDTCELTAICDKNLGRLQLRNDYLVNNCGHPKVGAYHSDDFDKMILTHKPDVVIVTSMDSTHDTYITRAMELGCDVITEKPMTINEKKCQAILDTMNKTKRKLRVTFNYRYSPVRSQIKELLLQKIIGEVLSVDFHWMLDTRHGADYYRRWHRNEVNSGGLLVHKATHHFDLLNWWIASTPSEVFCTGKRSYYVPQTADKLGLSGRSERCNTCKYLKEKCKFALDIASSQELKELYMDNEKFDGYFRDRCVFSPEIDIKDTMNVLVRYRNNVTLCYSLNSFLPWEGYTIRFNGTRGRLEHNAMESVYISGDGRVPGEMLKKGTYIRVYPQFEGPEDIEIKEATGGHGGGDPVLLEDLFSSNVPEDPLKRSAGFADGAWSILTGISANISIKTGKPVQTDALVKGIPEPEFEK